MIEERLTWARNSTFGWDRCFGLERQRLGSKSGLGLDCFSRLFRIGTPTCLFLFDSFCGSMAQLIPCMSLKGVWDLKEAYLGSHAQAVRSL